MKQPYRDLLVWLADLRPPANNMPAERAAAAVVAMLAAYDRDDRLAMRWEQRFTNSRTIRFPFGLGLAHQRYMRTYFRE